ncbi:WXG100 family type VII secretion target [Micromonospora sp. NBC_01813]|uniref:WXG100 family type VII secretion target n=1 Tax=Micromonospora sp. NBC_01813 TaxID=2975988 RepID=UPI002DD9D5D1|nr:hypothetical protein [Micromonospora sp. NBC_01813]WSA06274.1 hypothetical protein OG958_18275 [Micromonospora sp. NBC_01813]
MRIMASFPVLDDLATQMTRTVGQVDGEMATWTGAANAAQATWLDQAGGEFAAVHARWLELGELQNAMLAALETAVTDARIRYMEATQRSAALVRDVVI